MSDSDSSGKPVSSGVTKADGWERAKTLSSIVSAVFIPVVVLIVGNMFAGAIKEREVQGKFVELAVQILREEPAKQEAGLRQWGTEVLTRYSGVNFTPATQQALIKNTPLPAADPPGDRLRYKGRGFVGTTGSGNYAQLSRDLGIDLVANPERLRDLDVAAAAAATFFKQREAEIGAMLASGDVAGVNKRFIRRAPGGEARFEQLYKTYRQALEQADPQATTLSIPGAGRPGWLSTCVPALLKAMREKQLDPIVQAYALATADFETAQCTAMEELGR